jgi:hypothetical protein
MEELDMGCSSGQQLRQLDHTLDINSGLAYFTERRLRQYLPLSPILLLGTALGTVHSAVAIISYGCCRIASLWNFGFKPHAFLKHGTREPIE